MAAPRPAEIPCLYPESVVRRANLSETCGLSDQCFIMDDLRLGAGCGGMRSTSWALSSMNVAADSSALNSVRASPLER